MVHEGWWFDFPGRGLRYALDDLERPWPAVLAAVRGFGEVCEPSVVEAEIGDAGEPQARHHLVVAGPDGETGGTYLRDAARTRTVERIDRAALLGWVEEITASGAIPIAHLSIADGWYRCDAEDGDRLRLDEHRGGCELAVVRRGGLACVRGPAPPATIVAPLLLRLSSVSGYVDVDVLGSPWIDTDGVGRARFDRMHEALAAGGWTLHRSPAPEDLAWRRRPAAAVHAAPSLAAAPAPPRTHEIAWAPLPARTIHIGLGGDEDALVEALLAIEREDLEAEQPLSWRELDEVRRRAVIARALGVARGSALVPVAGCEIMRRPVTNAMWRAYVIATGASEPASWARGVVDEDPVTGVSPREAHAFAAHHGWTLPTEAEWVLAATGGDRRWFPWGAWSAVERGAGGASPLGVESLLGTAELTADCWAPLPGGDASLFPRQGLVCARGSAPQIAPCIPARRGVAIDDRSLPTRFRCVRRHPRG